MQRARRAAEALSTARAKMQRDLTVALSMRNLPNFVLVWGVGIGTNSSVPANISHMTEQQLAAFVWMLGDGSIDLIRNRHAGQRRSTFFIYLVFASKAAHLDCGMCHKDTRPFCRLALCNWTMKAGAIGLDGSMHPTSRYRAALLCLIVRISRWPHEPTRTRGAHRQPRPHIDRARAT